MLNSAYGHQVLTALTSLPARPQDARTAAAGLVEVTAKADLPAPSR